MLCSNQRRYLYFWRLVGPARIVPPSLELPIQAKLRRSWSSSRTRLFRLLWRYLSTHAAAMTILVQETPKMHLWQDAGNNKFTSAETVPNPLVFPFWQTDLKRALNLIGNLHQAVQSQRRSPQPAIPTFVPGAVSHQETQCPKTSYQNKNEIRGIAAPAAWRNGERLR